jgi:acetyltransferase-like isoleucine patch superfamily enzyme
MSFLINLRRGEGRFYGPLKRFILGALRFHLPAAGPLKVVFGVLYHLHVFAHEFSLWAQRFFWNEPLFRSQCESIGAGFWMERLPYMVGRGRIVIGSNVQISGKPSITFSNRTSSALPELRIGNRTFIGGGCQFSVARSIVIGERCLLAGGVYIQDHDGHPLEARRRAAGEPSPAESIRSVQIGDDVWIGTDAFILKGVTIGDRSVIGAKSVVTRDVPADTVVAGNPGRVIRSLEAH